MERDKRIKILADHLIWAINQAYIDSELIQEALSQIEEEGYQVDILLAAFTRFEEADCDGDSELPCAHHPKCIMRIEDDEEEMVEASSLSSEFNEFDRTFLKLIKVGYFEGL